MPSARLAKLVKNVRLNGGIWNGWQSFCRYQYAVYGNLHNQDKNFNQAKWLALQDRARFKTSKLVKPVLFSTMVAAASSDEDKPDTYATKDLGLVRVKIVKDKQKEFTPLDLAFVMTMMSLFWYCLLFLKTPYDVILSCWCFVCMLACL